MNWAEEESKTMELGDALLDRREVLLAALQARAQTLTDGLTAQPPPQLAYARQIRYRCAAYLLFVICLSFGA